VLAVQGDQVVVEFRPLTWDGHVLALGERGTETAVRSVDGVGMVGSLAVGDWVSLHWEWVCDRLTTPQVARLRDYTLRHLRIVDEGNLHAKVPHGPAALLDG
jgi:hypothetical protein